MSDGNYADGWQPYPATEPQFAGADDAMVGCLCVTDSGKLVPLYWARNLYAKTPAGQAPRWEWQGRISPWRVAYWTRPAPPT